MRELRKAMAVPDWVKLLRRRLGFTSQEAFSEKLKLGRSAVAKWEAGIQGPNVSSWRKMWVLAPKDVRELAPEVIASLGISDLPGGGEGPDPDASFYCVKTDQARILAKMLDAIEDDGARTAALSKCLGCLVRNGPTNNNT